MKWPGATGCEGLQVDESEWKSLTKRKKKKNQYGLREMQPYCAYRGEKKSRLEEMKEHWEKRNREGEGRSAQDGRQAEIDERDR